MEKETNYTKIATCLYSINKQAKKYRDKAKQYFFEAYCFDDEDEEAHASRLHRLGHNNKAKKEELYYLKMLSINQLFFEKKLKVIGYHTTQYGKLILTELEGFTFHSPTGEILEKYLPEKLVDLGELQEIPAERKRSTPPRKAEEVLKAYTFEMPLNHYLEFC